MIHSVEDLLENPGLSWVQVIEKFQFSTRIRGCPPFLSRYAKTDRQCYERLFLES